MEKFVLASDCLQLSLSIKKETPSDKMIRLECLKIASETLKNNNAYDITKYAEILFDYIIKGR